MIEKYGHEHKEHVVVDANVLVYICSKNGDKIQKMHFHSGN